MMAINEEKKRLKKSVSRSRPSIKPTWIKCIILEPTLIINRACRLCSMSSSSRKKPLLHLLHHRELGNIEKLISIRKNQIFLIRSMWMDEINKLPLKNFNNLIDSARFARKNSQFLKSINFDQNILDNRAKSATSFIHTSHFTFKKLFFCYFSSLLCLTFSSHASDECWYQLDSIH